MSLAKPQLYCIGANHKSASLDFREHLYIDSQVLEKILRETMRAYHFDEMLVLSTCNRFEMLALSLKGGKSQEDVYAAYAKLQILAGKTLPNREEFKKQTYFYQGLHSIEHIFAVTASLDSLVVGETQITSQFKKAVALAVKARTLGPYLDRLAQESLGIAKKVRSKTKISEKKVSISHTAIDLAKRVFRDLGEHSFLLVGAGEMAQVAALYASSYQPKNIHIVNRTFEKAVELVDQIGMGEAHAWSDLPVLLEKVDIVISSTAAHQAIIRYPLLKTVMSQRKGRALFLVDIAIPRDIEARCGEIDDVYLFEIDDLKKVVDGHMDARKKAAEEGRIMIKKAATNFDYWLNSIAVKPILANFRDYLQDLMVRESRKTLNRSLFEDLSEQQNEAIRHMLDAVAGKILGDAGRSIYKQTNYELREHLTDSLTLMFSSKVEEKESDQDKKDLECKNTIIRIQKGNSELPVEEVN